MQGIFTCIPETKHVPREYSVAAILLVLFMVLISLVQVLNLLCFYISIFRSMCTVPNMAVFWSSLTSCFPGMLLIITFTQGIYIYVRETTHVSRVYSVAAVLYLPSVLHELLFRPRNIFCMFTSALPPVRVQCQLWLLFCSFLISCFPDMLLRYFLSEIEKSPITPVIKSNETLT